MTIQPTQINRNKIISDKYSKIMELIISKYGNVDFETSGGSLLIKQNSIIIGFINRKNIDKWETIIDTKLSIIINTPKLKSIVDETFIRF